ncbi:hypothetical protein [Methylomarinum vadi]|uniref:hypothetical protein n=1 Tax=Methylomarinum vadi TaxID=438855 RepID=UPI0004DF96B2|nr:hypothetical protein [Methylomarinum vadi]
MRQLKFILYLSLPALLSGCVNLDAVGKFADGTEKLSIASAEFYRSELETDRKLAGLVVDLGETVPADESAWVNASSRGENLIAEARRNRAAVAALASYAESLREIAEYDDEEEIAESSGKLSRNLVSLSHELDSSSSVDESALAQAFTQLAGLYSKVKTRSVILEKVKKAQPHVETIVYTMLRDIERQQVRFSLARLSANVNREKWFNSFQHDYRSAGLADSQKSLLAMAAGQLVEDELAEKLSELPSRRFLEKLQKTANSCLAAHKAIGETGLKKDAKVLVEFAGDARDLYNSISDIP